MYNKKKIGKLGEDIVAQYLEEFHYKIIERNFRCKCGEIDIIAKDKDEMVFVEVKTRNNLYYGRPAEAVNKTKQRHIYKVAKYYLYINKVKNIPIRFDVIEVYLNEKNYKIEHLKNVEICE